MPVLKGFRVVQIGPGLAAAVCGRLMADVGATVTRLDADRSTPLAEHLNRDDTTDDQAWTAEVSETAHHCDTGQDCVSGTGGGTLAAVVPVSAGNQGARQDRVSGTGDGTLAAVGPVSAGNQGARQDRVSGTGDGTLAAAVPVSVGNPDTGKADAARTATDDQALRADKASATAVAEALTTADLIICEGSPATLQQSGHDAEALRKLNGRATLVLISPFGQTGPRAEEPATDLTLFFASGIARMLTGQVDDLDEPPMRPVGEQSAFLGGLSAACAGMHAALIGKDGAVVDVSIHEALATLAMTELTRAGQTGASWSRKRIADGNGATVCILPASDGYTAISPREDRQWAAWLEVMGSPAWCTERRFASKQDRIANWDALHALMSDWSRDKTKLWIAEAAQASHVPSFPLCEPAEHLGSAQLQQRNFFRPAIVSAQPVQVPGSPFGLRLTEGGHGPSSSISNAGDHEALPLSGIRVLDFSWVIAGPTATRYLAAMGAEVIKIEAPGRGDPGRASELHTVLGQAKKSIVLDLKKPEAIAVAKSLAARADVLVENFATGVMDRLGLGADALRVINPRLIYVSASGLGRTGPESQAVAYGTLLQCYAGFAGLNRHPGVPPRVGMAWLDPMCGLMLGFITAASIWRRCSGAVARVDFSMIEAMLWTMAEPLLSAQLGSSPGEPDRRSVVRCAGSDEWLGVGPAPGARAVEADALDDGLPEEREAAESAARLVRAGIPAAALARSADLVASEHLHARGFWDTHGMGVLPGLPWQASFGKATGPAPGLGADTDAVLRDVPGMSAADITRLRAVGALG
jgi:crotonobetainyl-CoA:carnitine CoA-transferase CaiB-like acyl-CoA transferase